jgi:hypothetical protein
MKMFDIEKDQCLMIYPRPGCESVTVTIAPVDLNKAFLCDITPSKGMIEDKVGYELSLDNPTTVFLRLTGQFKKDNTRDKYFVECKVRIAR